MHNSKVDSKLAELILAMPVEPGLVDGDIEVMNPRLFAAFVELTGEDWRAAIEAKVAVPLEFVEKLSPLFHEAVIFYTGTVPEISAGPAKETGWWVVTVSAVGYRNGPCGP